MKKKTRQDYKTERGWRRYVWRQIKGEIQEKTPEVDFKTFNARVEEKMYELNRKPRKKSASFKEAANALLRTEEYLSRADRLSENALNAIRADKEALYQLRTHTGWKEKLDPNKLRWSAKDSAYIYEGSKGKVLVDFTNSPKEIRVYSFAQNPLTGHTVKRRRA